MLNYLSELPDYARRLLIRVGTVSGILLGIVFFLAARPLGLGDGLSFIISAAIIAIAILEAGFALYRQERVMRSKLEENVTVTASLGRMSTNHPDPGPSRASLMVEVTWEIWVKEDVSTDKLALNLIYVYDKPWWQFWKRATVPQTGIPARGTGSTLYRKRISAQEPQPFRDTAIFEYVGDRHIKGDPHWVLELVLVTGVPAREHRIPVFIDLEEIRSRGVNPPL